MESIYNCRGQVVDTNIDHLDGVYPPASHGEPVYCQRGQHFGVFKGYFFCDYRSGVVAFKPNAKGGPGLTISVISPMLPFPAIPPIQVIPFSPPIPVISSFGWTAMNWQQFIRI